MEQEQVVKINEEELCRRCGMCCHRKKLEFGKVIFLKETCPHLEEDEHVRGKMKCKIYDQRFGRPLFFKDGVPFYCLSAEEAYRQGVLPPECPYVYYYKHGADKTLVRFLGFQGAFESQNWDGIVSRPKKNCNHCYGRGYIGRDVLTNIYRPCSCLGR